jgi:hypothetical protein
VDDKGDNLSNGHDRREQERPGCWPGIDDRSSVLGIVLCITRLGSFFSKISVICASINFQFRVSFHLGVQRDQISKALQAEARLVWTNGRVGQCKPWLAA